MPTPRHTTAAYKRSHGHNPRGNGLWAFQATTHATAFAAELHGPIVTASGTLAQALRKIASGVPSGVTVAVLP